MKTETIQEMAGMQDGAIVSKVLTQNGSTTLFALAQGEEIQEHTKYAGSAGNRIGGTYYIHR